MPRLPLLFVLGLVVMLPIAAASGSEGVPLPAPPDRKTPAERVVTDFTSATPDLGWYVVNDGVMGGRSVGDFEIRDDAVDFRGRTNTNGGGFSSIRTRGLELDLGGYEGIRVRVRGDGRTYTWRLTTDARWRGRRVGYWADFETKKDEWVDVDIPFTRFAPQWRGRMLSGLALDPAAIQGMGLMIYDKKDGPFALQLASVRAYRTPPPFSLSELRWSSRVLVVSAASSDDDHVRKQLADVTLTGQNFRERDMVLVTLFDGDGSRAGERALSSAEVRAVREAMELPGDAFSLRLVGKDGGVKRASDAYVPIRDLYTQIDAMPMRRDEMRARDSD